MKEYQIKCMDHAPMCCKCWSRIEAVEINECVWGDAYKPKCTAQVVFVPGDAFYARLTCEEKNPRAVHGGFYSEVYKDSCLEMFAIWDDQSDRYVNVEMNSIGASLAAFGPDRYDRTPIDRIIGHPFEVQADRNENAWSVTVRIPLEDLCTLYGMSSDKFVPGYVIRGNFYKCGDDCEIAHYIMWNPVETENPDYHRPEFFGKMVIGE
ncbi:MAG: hypothetical protein J6S76_00410 [Clostridia bacterium]|nr:hypothetical protein [Clostridia bacterium]